MRRPINLHFAAGLGAILLWGAGCAPPCPVCRPMAWAPPPMPMYAPPPAMPTAPVAPAPAATAPAERAKVAVLPIDDDQLFRAERADLRLFLANQLAKLATEHTILSLAEVDTKLRPVSATTGARCAFSGEPAERRAHEQGWLATDLLHVSGLKGNSEELWVQFVGRRHVEVATWEAPWYSQLGLTDRYRASFAALVQKKGDVGLLGGLGMSGSDKGAFAEGPITICETKRFSQCDASSAAWKDKAGQLASCFTGEDESTTEILLQGDEGSARCEIAGLDAPEDREGKREACLCGALGASPAFRSKAGRRTVRVRFEAIDLANKPRPELRVVESTNNLDSEAEWHSMKTERDGKASYSSVQRLVVDHLDGLAAPLARCAVPAGSVVVADVDVREDGAIDKARLLTGLARKDSTQCIEKALGRGSFICTDDGKAAKVRIAISWPEAVK